MRSNKYVAVRYDMRGRKENPAVIFVFSCSRDKTLTL